MHLEELEVADEAFFTGTAAEVTPISALDRKPIGNGKPGPVTLELQRAYFAATSGKDPKHRDWLTRVNAKSEATKTV